MKRPQPPRDLQRQGSLIVPAPELSTWLRHAFIEGGTRTENPDHKHLKFARLACLWTNVPNARGMSQVVGQAEIPRAQGGKWQKARHDAQLRAWFGHTPDFLITLYAPYWMETENDEACAIGEHELYHCGQAVNEFGAPKFTKNGLPVFGLKAHDVEEFVGIVARYGPGAAAGQTRKLVEAANRKPLIARADISTICANCLKK